MTNLRHRKAMGLLKATQLASERAVIQSRWLVIESFSEPP